MLATLPPLRISETVLHLSREESILSAIGDVRIANDGTVTGTLGLDSNEGFWFPERPFLWRKGGLAWLSTEGYRGGSVAGFDGKRAVGWLGQGAKRWAVEWQCPASGDWAAAKPRRLRDEPCSTVLLDRAGQVWIVAEKALARLDAPKRKTILGAVQPVAIDPAGNVYGNAGDGWNLRWAARVSPDGATHLLTGETRPSHSNDADSAGRAVGNVTFDRHEPDGGLSQPPLPVEWRNGKARPLLALGPSGDALAIGDGGDVVGWYEAGNARRACRWRGGRCEALPVPVGWEYDSIAVAVNRAGTAVVIASDRTGTTLCLVPRP